MTKKDEKKQETSNSSVYSRNELIMAASSFGVKPEVMAGALKLAGKDELTKDEAKESVKKYLKRKV